MYNFFSVSLRLIPLAHLFEVLLLQFPDLPLHHEVMVFLFLRCLHMFFRLFELFLNRLLPVTQLFPLVPSDFLGFLVKLVLFNFSSLTPFFLLSFSLLSKLLLDLQQVSLYLFTLLSSVLMTRSVTNSRTCLSSSSCFSLSRIDLS